MLLLVCFDTSDLQQLGGFAQTFGQEFDALILNGPNDDGFGARKILTADLAENPTADSVSAAIAAACSGYSHVAGLSSMRGKDLLARVAGHLDAPMVTDVLGFTSPSVFQRPMVAGSVIATVEVTGEPVVLTIRPTGFPKAEPKGESPADSIHLDLESKSERVSVASRGGGGRPDLTQAKVVVSGGRPLGDAATFESLIGGLADRLGGATGATRAAVDSGIAANELQVGQTGKIVAPDLYIAAGISGSTQHMAGMKDSKTIVAINTDGDAPIFQIADFGLVMDLHQALPELISKV
jgi:electron transfer flavoprotein alpha subunit